VQLALRLLKTVTVDKKFFQHSVAEYKTRSHLERPEHSASSFRIEQPTERNMHCTRSCDAAAQVKCSARHISPEGPLACQNSKALALRVPPAAFHHCICPAEKTHWQYHIRLRHRHLHNERSQGPNYPKNLTICHKIIISSTISLSWVLDLRSHYFSVIWPQEFNFCRADGGGASELQHKIV